MLHTGDIAPDFTLPCATGGTASLHWVDDWRLVWWLPSTMLEHASGCGDRIAHGFAHEDDDRLTVFGLSFDDEKTMAEFARRAAATFPLLCADIETGKAYGVYRGDDDEWNCFPKKRAFLVDPNGRIAKVYNNIDPDFFVAEVLADVEELAPRKRGLSRFLASLKG